VAEGNERYTQEPRRHSERATKAGLDRGCGAQENHDRAAGEIRPIAQIRLRRSPMHARETPVFLGETDRAPLFPVCNYREESSGNANTCCVAKV
jgi:hypothetical protein